MAKTLLTSKGTPVKIGRQLGKGGEGSVLELPLVANQVAKLYHQLPDKKKQAKLAFMASTADPKLLHYIAWPQETLHSSKGGPVVGFLMPKVVGKDPIHMIYSPAHRRQNRPKTAWDFLLFVGRNTAAAFEALHAKGHVLGDVNQGNILVGGDSKVVLIDSDSFQVNTKSTQHLCEVGVSHFTPPELQGLSSFQGFIRTANHDNFGLALLIFHLLFGGRHPYSGVPSKTGVGETLEADIKGFRYAYAPDALKRGISPPPRSIPISMLPDSMVTMFQQAFTEKGVVASRPTAKQWVAALDTLRNRLKKCNSSAVHVYPDHLSKCPWCALEQQGVVYFIDLGTTYTSTTKGFNLTHVWAQIEAVPLPSPYSPPNISSIQVTPTPLPADISGAITVFFLRAVVVGIAFLLLTALPKVWPLIAFGAWVSWTAAGSTGSKELSAERAKRKAALDIAQKEFNSLVDRIKKDSGTDEFHKKKAEFKKLRDEMQTLPAQESQELSKLHLTAQERQKKKFLEGFFIDAAEISGVGPARKAALRSFGIETAADISRNQVMQIKGFGESLTRAVTDWKASIERRFVFNPATAISATDKNIIRAKFGARKNSISATLVGAPAELQRLTLLAGSRAHLWQPQLEQAAKKLAQARSDITLL